MYFYEKNENNQHKNKNYTLNFTMGSKILFCCSQSMLTNQMCPIRLENICSLFVISSSFF